jgi:hypothetical protein
VGLYSALARQNLAEARAWLRQRGYGSSPDDVRRAREDMLRHDGEETLSRVFESEDFFTTSSCRDLLFHAQESGMRLPQIGAFIRSNDLTFLGLAVDEVVRRQFRSRFPDDAALTDFASWDAFETDHPWVFARMYAVWVSKRPTA